MNTQGPRQVLLRYVPLVLSLLGLAAFVTIVPSRTGLQGGGEAVLPSGDSPAMPGQTASATPGPGQSPGQSPQGGQVFGPGSSSVGSVGTTAGAWRQTGVDCSRRAILRDSPTCRPTPAWKGDNGGSTYRNVTGEEVRIVYYRVKAIEQLNAILGAAGVPTPEEIRDAVEAFEVYFNKVFETYGRHVKLIFQHGPNEGQTAETNQADAQTAVEQNKAFAIVAGIGGPGDLPFWKEVARQKVPGITDGDGYYPTDMYAKLAPYVRSVLPEPNLALDHVARYSCRRLAGRNAVHSGDPLMQGQKRKFGIIYNESLDWGPVLKRKVEACGGRVGKIVGYPSDITRAAQLASNVVSQMRDAGITTVTLAGDAYAPIFITKEATKQGWFPEWIIPGLGSIDIVLAGRLYDQQQWSHAFGVTGYEYYVPAAERSSWKAYFAGKPNGSAKVAYGAAYYAYPMILYAFAAIEAAGPNLTAASFINALTRLPASGGKGNIRQLSLGVPPGPYSFVDDMMEIWWDVDRIGPDGKPGWFFYVKQGERYLLNDWPASEPVVLVDDGSRQPGRDPNAS